MRASARPKGREVAPHEVDGTRVTCEHDYGFTIDGVDRCGQCGMAMTWTGIVTETHCCECGGDHSCDVCPVFDGMYEDDDDLPTGGQA